MRLIVSTVLAGVLWRRLRTALLAALAVCSALVAPISAGDRVSELNERLQARSVVLEYDARRGYLDSLLAECGVEADTQTLVFSKTSLLQALISPSNPRALYFGDDVYIGWVPGGDRLEVAAIDPVYGAEFYTLEQQQTDEPRLVRDVGNCLACHESHRTRDVPGLLLRSVFPDANAHPNGRAGSFVTTDASPFVERYGGWYVTGTHGSMRYMGNVLQEDDVLDARSLDREAGANRTEIPGSARPERYLTSGSDLVALIVMTHQSQVHNDVTRLASETRAAERHDAVMNELLGRPPSFQSDSTKRRIRKESERLVRSLLMLDEFRLTSDVRGVSNFASRYSQLGPIDSRGRSFRELDLETRLFKYGCSPLIYSPSIEQLPETASVQFRTALHKALSVDEGASEVPANERQIIREILADTCPEMLVVE